jgi:hypothetical protein
MQAIKFAQRALSFVAVAVLLAGCGGDVGSAPMQTSLLPPSNILGSAHTKRADSWMLPEATSEDLLYVSDAAGVVDVLSYPDGKLVGVLKGFSSPAGLCSDAAGNVFVTDTNNLNILEYRHGAKKPLKTPLNDFGHYPFGCAVDPGTKNVAVANYASTLKNGPGSVSVFVGGKGEPHSYQNTAFNAYFFCSYDDKGNLFVDGADYGSYHTLFAELANGSSTLTSVTLDKTIGYPGGVQWDGKYIAVQDTYGHAIYRFSISGSSGTSMGAVHIKGDKSGLLAQFWIDGNTVVVPYGTKPRETRSVGLWPYTGGGSPTKGFAVEHATELVGATVSLAKK